MSLEPLNNLNSTFLTFENSPKNKKRLKVESEKEHRIQGISSKASLIFENRTLLLEVLTFLNVREMFAFRETHRRFSQNGNILIQKAIISQLASKRGSFDISDLFRYAFRYPSLSKEEVPIEEEDKKKIECDEVSEPITFKRTRAYFDLTKTAQENTALSILAPALKNITELTEESEEFIQNYAPLMNNIGTMMKSLESLSLSIGELISDKEYLKLSLSNSLKKLSIRWLPDYLASTISTIANLQVICLYESKITDETVKHLVHLEHLNTLEIPAHNLISHVSVETLSKCKNLTYVNFAECRNISTNQAFKHFTSYPKLRNLKVGSSMLNRPEQFNAEGISYLFSCALLNSLSIIGVNKSVRNDDFAAFASFPINLKKLCLTGDGVTYEIMKIITKALSELETLDLRNCSICYSENCSIVRDLPNLTSLSILRPNEAALRRFNWDLFDGLNKPLSKLIKFRYEGIIDSKGMSFMTDKFPNLTSLSIFPHRISDINLEPLGKLNKLTKLTLRLRKVEWTGLQSNKTLNRLRLILEERYNYLIFQDLISDGIKSLKTLEIKDPRLFLTTETLQSLSRIRESLSIILKEDYSRGNRKIIANNMAPNHKS